jgi:NAD(P)-dependent dehydrogenase (short-subunit alcohol dehydrogenase family)
MGFFYSQLFITPPYPTASLAGQTIIVTGANTGLGKEAARHIARLGVSKLILAVRNTAAGEAAKRDIETTTKCSADIVEVWSLDLSSYASVQSFAERASKLDRLDVLLENAGVASNEFILAEGHERSITIVSSGAHGHAAFPEQNAPNVFAALDQESTARMFERYPASKLLEVLIVKELAPKMDGGVVLNMLSPGLCHSELAREGGIYFTVLKFFLARSTEVGSRTLVASAVAGMESHGRYMEDGVVNDGATSDFVRSDEGKMTGQKVWRELSEILEAIQPGITSNI